MLKVGFIVIILIVIGFGLWRYSTQSQLYTINVPIADNFPANYFAHNQFEQLLQRFVSTDGNINYQQWLDSDNGHFQLQQYLAAVAKYSPNNTPEMFNSKQDELAYWIYSYNALVIHLILSNWPLDSVTNIKAPVEIIKGLGFFYNQKFVIGSETLNLYQLEQQKMVNTKADARLHFALNCGSASCPPMRPQLPVGIELLPFLEQVTDDFINNSANVRFNAEGNLEVSSIFNWYIDDFALYAKQHLNKGDLKLNKQQALIVFIDHFSDENISKKLQQAPSQDVRFISYDWAINNSTNNSMKTKHKDNPKND